METGALDTYNRVPSLQAPAIRSVFKALYLTLITIIIAATIRYSLDATALLHFITTILTIFLLYGLILLYDHKRTARCQFCSNTLKLTIRPLILSAHFLSMKGQRVDNYFFTQRAIPGKFFSKRWVKIFRQSYVCHHCRLIEEQQHEYSDIVSDEELKTLCIDEISES